MTITGNTLIEWGFEPGPWFSMAIAEANNAREAGMDDCDIFELVKGMKALEPEYIPLRTNALHFATFIEPESDVERENVKSVVEAMDRLMRVPTIEDGAIMPDACPAGTIPVGGVVRAKNAIHPGYHSADICCSMAITVFKRDMDPTGVLNVAEKITHFGPGRRAVSQVRQHKELLALLAGFENNLFLSGLEEHAERHFMTQGDGNHFLFVGRLRSTGQIALVTHHGSRGLGAWLYKRGMLVAQRETRKIAKVSKNDAWLQADTQIGQDYWAALQVARQWTKMNHFAIHDMIAQKLGNEIVDRFWNEHNFVFQRSDGDFYHAKGATPSYAGFSPDDDGRALIPLNMSEPILITRHADRSDALGFAPHGAGRNMSRTSYMKNVIGDRDPASVLAEVRERIDARFFTGVPDVSELPGAYKNAAQVVGQIEKHGLAHIDDYVDPFGSIMAGQVNWSAK